MTRTISGTEKLRGDHVIVLEKLRELRESAAKLKETGSSLQGAKESIKGVAAFLARDLEIHLKQEEEALFPPLEAVIGSEGGPTAVMRMEHVDIRAKNGELQALVKSLDSWEQNSPQVKQAQSVSVYLSSLLGQHIDKEDHILFPMADEILNQRIMGQVEEKMRTLEA